MLIKAKKIDSSIILNVSFKAVIECLCMEPLATNVITSRSSTIQPWISSKFIIDRYLFVMEVIAFFKYLSMQYVNSINWIFICSIRQASHKYIRLVIKILVFLKDYHLRFLCSCK